MEDSAALQKTYQQLANQYETVVKVLKSMDKKLEALKQPQEHQAAVNALGLDIRHEILANILRTTPSFLLSSSLIHSPIF